MKPILTTVGKFGELNVRTYVLVNFVSPLRRTVILRKSVTPSTMPSLISSLVTLFKAGQQIIPLDVFKDDGVLRSILDYKMSSSVVDFFPVTLLHIVSKYQRTLDSLSSLVLLQCL